MFRKKSSRIDDIYSRAHNRAAAMGISDMIDWIDATGTDMARDASDFRRHRSPSTAHEIRDKALIIAAMADAMEKRFDRMGK